MRTQILCSAVIGLRVCVSSEPSSAQNCAGRSFTSSAEFAAGQHQGYSVEWFNVQDRGDKLEIATAPGGMFPYLSVACSARGTVARVYVGNNVYDQYGNETRQPYVVGEYWTFPSTSNHTDNSTHGDPSRTTVDHYGSTWVANRAENTGGKGSVTRVALAMWKPEDVNDVIADEDDHGCVTV